MKEYVRTEVYPLPDLDYFIEQLGWEVSSMDEVFDFLETLCRSELEELLGYPNEYSKIR